MRSELQVISAKLTELSNRYNPFTISRKVEDIYKRASFIKLIGAMEAAERAVQLCELQAEMYEEEYGVLGPDYMATPIDSKTQGVSQDG